jgi:DNA-directed RNA polymerase specialized sigma24 family protein
MSAAEVLAVTRLRQWNADRLALRASRTTDYRRHGWQARDTRTFDARLVRVLDFERALGRLPEEEQMLLLLTYRERQRYDEISKILNCSLRKVTYALPTARRHLADILDKLDIL